MDIVKKIEQLIELLNSSNPIEANINIKVSEISELLRDKQIKPDLIVLSCDKCKREFNKYVGSKKYDLHVYFVYMFLQEMLSIWLRNTALRLAILAQLDQLAWKHKIILLGDYHADLGVSMFIQTQQNKLLSHGYKVICLELPCNKTLKEYHENFNNCPIPPASNIENKLHYDETKRRLNLKDKFDIVFIDPQCTNDFLDDHRIQSTKIVLFETLNHLREDGMALMILKTAIHTHGGIVAQTGLKHFLSLCKNLNDFDAKLIPIIPFNDSKVLFADSIVSEIQQNLSRMDLPKLLTLSCTDIECLNYTGKIQFIEQPSLANSLFANHRPTLHTQAWIFEEYISSLASCDPPRGSKVKNGITVVPRLQGT